MKLTSSPAEAKARAVMVFNDNDGPGQRIDKWPLQWCSPVGLGYLEVLAASHSLRLQR